MAISDKKEFSRVYQSAKKWHTDYAVLYFLESPYSKFAAVAGKKIGKAVKRNRAKRVLRSAFYSVSDEIRSGVYILIAKAKINQTAFEKIAQNLKWSLKKLGCL